MARSLRIEYPGAVYHGTGRGNERKPICRTAADRTAFLETRAGGRRDQWRCHAYCLVDNYYHRLIETPDANRSRGMRQVNGV